MTFFAYPITALAESDATGTDGKNIVANAVVTATDLDLNTVLMYDDESGANPNTLKTLDLKGEGNIFFTPGEYLVSINGGTAKQITIAGNAPVAYQTFADMESLRPNKTGQEFICQERANARYILQPVSYLAQTGDVTFANGRVGALQIDGWINIRWMGATELTDSTTAIQNALDRAASAATSFVGSDSRIIYSPIQVYIPSGAYLVSSTLTQNSNFVEIVGDGVGSTVLYREDGTYGNTLEIKPVDPTTSRLIGAGVKGIKFDARVDMVSGAHLHLESVTQYDFESLFFENGFISIEGGGLQNCTFTNIFAEVGRYYPTLRTGTRFLKIFESTYENTEVFFDTFNWTFTVNATVEAGIEINEGDGIWFSDGHILGADTELLINGDGSSQCAAMLFNDVWFDGFCSKNVHIKGVATGIFKNIEFNSCKFTGATSQWMLIESGCNVKDVTIDEPKFKNCNGSGIDAVGGTSLTINGLDADDVARAGAANQYVVRVPTGSTLQELIINGGKITATTIDYGVRVLESGCTGIIKNINFRGVQVEEVDILSAGFSGSISGCETDRANANDFAVASTVDPNPISDVINITGTTGTIDSIRNAWDGRSIVLRGDSASHTISHNTGNILINGNANITLNANRGRRLTYSADAGAWYDA